ncbi:MAG: phosphotyrosine protein phosphatase [Planctomycetota bacterium]
MEQVRILFVCARNKWRSPTAERIFGRDPRFQCRACGFSSKSARVLSDADVGWADAVCVMEREHARRLKQKHRDALGDTPLHVLEIADQYRFMDPGLIELLEARFPSCLGEI